MKRLIILLLISMGFLFAAEKTFIREYTYQASDYDSKVTSRANALEQVKRILLEEVSIYMQSEFEMRDWEEQIGDKIESGEFAEQRILSITAGITKTEIVEEKWTKKLINSKYWMKAKITLDPEDIQSKIKEVIDNKRLLADLERSRKQAQDAIADIEMLKKQLAKSEEEKEKLKLEYEQKTNILLAAEMFQKGLNAQHINKEYDKAISFYLEVLELLPDDANTYVNLGVAYNRQGNTTQAIEYYVKAIELDPDYAEAYNNLGVDYKDQGDLTKAIESYEKSIEIDPDYAEAYYNLGNAYKDQGDTTKAIESYEKAIEIDPDYAMAYVNLGNAYSNQGNNIKAIESYERAIELDPDDAVAYLNLGNCYFESDFSTTLIYYKKAARLGYKPVQDWLKKNGYDW